MLGRSSGEFEAAAAGLRAAQAWFQAASADQQRIIHAARARQPAAQQAWQSPEARHFHDDFGEYLGIASPGATQGGHIALALGRLATEAAGVAAALRAQESQRQHFLATLSAIPVAQAAADVALTVKSQLLGLDGAQNAVLARWEHACYQALPVLQEAAAALRSATNPYGSRDIPGLDPFNNFRRLLGYALKGTKGAFVQRVSGYTRANGTVVAAYYRWLPRTPEGVRTALGSANRVAAAAKLVSRVGTGVAVVEGAFSRYKRDEGRPGDQRAVRAATAGVVAGGVALGAGQVGAVIGTAVGGPVGFVVGAGVGIAVGAGYGWVDSHFHITDKVVDGVSTAYEGGKEVVGEVGHKLSHAGSSLLHAGSSLGSGAKHLIGGFL